MTYLIVGLGNPGVRYAQTRHNAGFLAVNAIADKLNVNMKKKFLMPAEIVETFVDDKKIVLAKPTTFMNLSGKAVMALARKYRVLPEHIVIISDDVTLPNGTIRLRIGGSAGGHNGLKSVIEAIGDSFIRVRIGVGVPPPNVPLEAYVLQNAQYQDLTPFLSSTRKAGEIALDIVQNGVREQTIVL